MALQGYDDLNDMHLDVLREIGNIGSGNAASALSSMLGRPVDIAVPKIKILDFEQVAENLGGPEQELVALMLTLEGDVTGMMMFLLNKNFAYSVLNTLLGTEFDENMEIDEMSQSAILEVGNIMAASYANAMSSLTGLTINISVPSLSIDMVGSVLSVPAIYYANIGDKIIFIEDEFDKTEGVDSESGSHILMIPEVDALNKIMDSLGLGE